MIIIPCDSCLTLPICKNIEEIFDVLYKCSILKKHMKEYIEGQYSSSLSKIIENELYINEILREINMLDTPLTCYIIMIDKHLGKNSSDFLGVEQIGESDGVERWYEQILENLL